MMRYALANLLCWASTWASSTIKGQSRDWASRFMDAPARLVWRPSSLTRIRRTGADAGGPQGVGGGLNWRMKKPAPPGRVGAGSIDAI